MSLASNLSDFATRIATESKSLRTLLNGNAADLNALTTTAKNNLVAAINELNGLIEELSGGGSATQFSDLTDVSLTTLTSGDMTRWNGTDWVNFATTTYGRTLLALADAAALTATLSAASETVSGRVELATTAEALTGTDTTRAVTPAGVQAKFDALVGDAPGLLNTLGEISDAIADNADFAGAMTTALAGKQASDPTLTALAGLTVAADQMIYSTGADAFSATNLTAFARTLLDDGDAATARGTLSVYSQAQIGDPEQDLVAVFEAGLV